MSNLVLSLTGFLLIEQILIKPIKAAVLYCPKLESLSKVSFNRQRDSPT